MNSRNFFVIIILLASACFAPAGLRAQTYQEMDAEPQAAENKFWETNLNSAYEKALREFNAGNYENKTFAVKGFLCLGSSFFTRNLKYFGCPKFIGKG